MALTMALTSNAQAGSSRQGQRAKPERAQSSDEGSGDERIVKPEAGEDIELDEDGLEDWTVDRYVQQTLQKDIYSDSSLTKVLNEIKAMEQGLTDSMGIVIETAEQVEDGSAGDPMVEELAKGLCRSIEIREILRIRMTVIQEVQRKIRAKEEITNPRETCDQMTADRTEAYMKKTPRQKFGRDEDYTKFRNEVWQINNSNACPPMSHWLDKTDRDESDEDDDVEVGPTLANYKCAASHIPIKDAMVNPGCGHHYSKEFVMQLFDQAGRVSTIKCPAVGCQKMVSKSAIKPDKAFQAKADQHFRRETQRQNDEVEDVDELSD